MYIFSLFSLSFGVLQRVRNRCMKNIVSRKKQSGQQSPITTDV